MQAYAQALKTEAARTQAEKDAAAALEIKYAFCYDTTIYPSLRSHDTCIVQTQFSNLHDIIDFTLHSGNQYIIVFVTSCKISYRSVTFMQFAVSQTPAVLRALISILCKFIKQRYHSNALMILTQRLA